MRRSPPAAQGSNLRALAPAVFRACLTKRITVEEAIAAEAGACLMEGRDRALLASILLTAFRHLGEIEAVIAKLLEKPLPRKSGTATDILTLGAAQLLFLNMPPHAVIDLSVRAAKADRNARHFSGLINAVLRKCAAGGQALRQGIDPARLNTPGWLWRRWSKAFGEETCRRIAEAHLQRPVLDLTFRTEASEWEARLGGIVLPNGQIRLAADHAAVTNLPGFAEGAWWVQDAAATVPAWLAGAIRGKTALDLCAAPGGKTLQLAAMGADVTAIDISERRLGRLRDNLARTGLSAAIREQDILSEDLTGQWDVVLLDAPCSATGTIRRHPELPHLKQEGQIAELAELQRRMIGKAAELVKPGGTMVYCTCSLQPEEGEEQVKAFLAVDHRFETVPARVAWLPAGSVGPEGWVRTVPFMTLAGSPGMDGFFAAALRRRV